MKSQRLPATLAGAVALFSLLLGGVAAADIRTYGVNLSGAQEVPPVVTGGVGGCLVTLDDVTGMVTVNGSYQGMNGNVTASHIHGPAPAGANAGILIGLTPTGGTSGNISGGGTLSAANVTNMLNGLTYVNVHSTTSPGGEIRGQIVQQVPSLSPVLLGVLAVLAVAGGAFVLTRRPA
ncbi:MAG TPA: CHRD domain-containing protein [Planctomycetota bacterium]